MHFRYIRYIIAILLLSVWFGGCGSSSGGESSTDALLDDNTPPVAFDQELDISNSVVEQDSRLHILLEAQDADGDELSYSIIKEPQHGVLEGKVPELYYMPHKGYVGKDSFVFEVNDSIATAIGVIDIDIIKVNRPPKAVDDNVSAEEDKAIAIDVLENDIDLDSNHSVLHIVSVSKPTVGRVTFDKKHIYYIADGAMKLSDRLSYTIADEYNATSSANVYIDIRRNNHTPVAYSQDIITREDTPISIELNASDIDGDRLSYKLSYTKYIPAHGTISGILPHLIYTPSDDFTGDDYLSFYVDDGELSSKVAVVNIRVIPINDAPIANAGEDTDGTIGDSIVLDGSKSYDIDGRIVSYKWIENNETISTKQSFTKTFTKEGVYNISLIVTDDKNATGKDKLTIDINLCNKGCIYLDPTKTVPFN